MYISYLYLQLFCRSLPFSTAINAKLDIFGLLAFLRLALICCFGVEIELGFILWRYFRKLLSFLWRSNMVSWTFLCCIACCIILVICRTFWSVFNCLFYLCWFAGLLCIFTLFSGMLCMLVCALNLCGY